MKNKITMKDKILYLLLPFIVGCSTATAKQAPKTWSQAMNTPKISTYTQLDHTEPEVKPTWLRKTPKEDGAFYFVGMSARRSERKDAFNESFNDAMISFARYCGLNVSVIEEHKDVSIGGNGGVIDTLTQGNSFAKMRAELYMGNVTTEDRYLERYSNFHGGSFMGHSFLVSTLIRVPKDEMDTCRANRKVANTYMEEQSETIAKLSKKNETLENRIQVVERNNQTLAMNQVTQTNKFFEQIKNNKQKRKKKVLASVSKKVIKKNSNKTGNTVSKVIANKVTKKKFVPKKVIATNTGPKWTRDFTNSGTNVSSNSKRFVQRTENLDKTNTTVTNLDNFKGCIIGYWGGAVPGVPCESTRNKYEGSVIIKTHYNEAGNPTGVKYFPHGQGVMYTAVNPGQKYIEGIFKYGKIVSGNYYQSQTGKLFKRVVNGQFVSLNN
tara:strand:+ start:661 stop:1974 length:1314 start_codon:yes stop_codon:yes gene_type:complete